MHEDEYVDSSSSRTSDSLLNTKVDNNNNNNNHNTTAPPLVPVVVEEDTTTTTTTTTTTNTTMMMMMTTTTTTEENDRESNHHLNNNDNNNDSKDNDNNNSDNNNPAVEESSKNNSNSNDTNDNDDNNNDNDTNTNTNNSTTPSTQPITEITEFKEPDKTTTTTDDVKMEYELINSNEKEKEEEAVTTTIHPTPKDDNTNHNKNNNKEDTATIPPITNGENHQSATTTTATTEATPAAGSSSNSNSAPLNGAAISTSTTAAAAATTETTTTSDAAAAAAALPQPPVMKGTLCIDMVHEQQYRHLIRGMWNYENSTTFPPQRFELLRNLSSDDEDIHTLPVDGEFHGSFSLAYFHTTSKGKQKERSKIIPETGVKIKFIPVVSTTTTTDTSKDQNDNNESSSGNDTTTSTTPIISEYQVEGTGTNQFGIFHIYGTATRNPPLSESDTTPTMSIVFRKRYEPGLPTTTAVTTDTTTTTTTTAMTSTLAKDTTKSQYGDSTSAMITTTNGDGTAIANNATAGPLPDPAPSFASGIVALRGKLFKEESNDLGTTEVVHRINGTWASGLDYIEADPQNLRGLCNRFEYEHKSAVPTQQFPVSGKYSGWFDLSNEDGTRTRINERDVLLKFRPNNQGYQNVEGKGSNVFGKYTITGTLTEDNIITIFRHFQPRKFKKSTSATNTTLSSLNVDTSSTTNTTTAVVSNVTSSTTESNSMVLSSSSTTNATNVRRSMTNPTDYKLSLDDVKIPTGSTNGTDGDDTEPYDPIVPPVSGTYSAVSRGVLRINDDGSHSCQGKWAATREHITNGQTSNFTFRLEPHFVVQESTNQTGGGGNGEKVFPLDSAMYKGSFQLKKQASRYQTIIDQQIVMKFRRNKHGAYNVHGTGINAIGEFNLLGTLVTSGKTGGQVELYRMYPPEKLAVQPAVTTTSSVIPKPESTVGSMGATLPKGTNSAASAVSATGLSSASGKQQQQQNQMQRRESSRMSKLPSRLEEDDPDAQLSRTMDKCLQILKFMRERDVELGAFFSEPVDPIALGIPTYVHIIKEPMDLRTIENKMNAGSVQTPEEFSRLVRLVFENAMTFNVDPGHSVHQAARSLLVIFNQKFRDVERMVQSIRRAHGIDVDETGKPRGKDDKKRKRQEEPKSMKRIRIEEAQAMTTANAAAVSAIVAAMPTSNVATVSRNEFSLLLNLVQQLQQQVVQTHLAVAELCPGDANDEAGGDTIRSSSGHDTSKTNASSTGEKKKAVKRKADVMEESYVPPVETSLPLTEKEQELMMETINAMSQEHLGGVLEIIRETALVDENDDVIDLGIDQLDDATQRKLFRHIQVYLKKTKAKPKKKMKTNPPQPPPKKVVEKAPPPKKPQAAPKPKQAASSDSFFRFGQKNGSDSEDDSDDDDNNGATYRSNANAGGKQISSFAGADDFNLGDGLDLADDNDEDNTEIPVNWGDISNQNATGSNKKDNDDEEEDDDDDNDDWGKVAREQAAIAKARDAARRAREEKKKAEAEQASRIRLAEAAHRGEEIKAQRAEDEAKEATLREQQEREAEAARQKAKNAARAQLSSLQQTVDLDAQRDIMKQYDFDSKDLGGASPSSDFGF